VKISHFFVDYCIHVYYVIAYICKATVNYNIVWLAIYVYFIVDCEEIYTSNNGQNLWSYFHHGICSWSKWISTQLCLTLKHAAVGLHSLLMMELWNSSVSVPSASTVECSLHGVRICMGNFSYDTNFDSSNINAEIQ